MRVIATDADDGDTPNAQIAYRIDPNSAGADMFEINSRTGEIRVKKNSIDREVSYCIFPIILCL